jgi:hypothetical protein
MFTLAFWKAATERATKTAAQAAILQLVVGDGFNAFDADWATAGGFALGGLVLSYLTSLASGAVGNDGPSLANETVKPTILGKA